MAALRNEVKAFIVQALACFDTPSQVATAVKEQFGVEVSRQQCEMYNPTKHAGKSLAAKWVTLFEDTRKRFREETADIPIANRAYRLRMLDRMATRAELMKNLHLAAQLLEQAAKESGNVFTNKHKHELAGPGGVPLMTPSLTDEQLETLARKINDEV